MQLHYWVINRMEKRELLSFFFQYGRKIVILKIFAVTRSVLSKKFAAMAEKYKKEMDKSEGIWNTIGKAAKSRGEKEDMDFFFFLENFYRGY